MLGQRLLRAFTLNASDDRDGKPLEHWAELEGNHKTIIRKDANGTTYEVWQPVDDDFWRRRLHGKTFLVLRSKGTEFAHSSTYDKFYPKEGYFACRACGLPLYSAKAKFDSGTGWPSFGEHIEGNVVTDMDYTLGMKRTECCCRRCHSHLGHVFAESNVAKFDRLKKFSERQCINGVALKYIDAPLAKGSNPSATAL